MHIPDGYLSPQTCAAAFVVAVPTFAVATRRVTRVVKTRNVPMLAILSALSFLVMMFNIPIPDGTTAHAVGGVIIAICLGPWAAVIAVAVALLFQALLFGDGGVLAFGANAVNMAIIMPFIGYGAYRLIAGRSPLSSGRRVTAAAIGGYLGINAAGLATAIELGIQPDLFHTASGAPLYSPYHLSQAIAAMALAHLTVAGAAEAVLTGGVFAYLARTDATRLAAAHPGIPATAGAGAGAGGDGDGRAAGADGTGSKGARGGALTPARAAIGFIAVMVLLTPLGLLAPGGAFGEDAPEDLDLGKLDLQTVPTGLNRYNGFWSHTVLGGYGFHDGRHANLGYLLSAVIGIAVVAVVIYTIGTLAGVVTRRRGGPPTGTAAGESSRA
jgi:cobalt/nickel transport system permease protein